MGGGERGARARGGCARGPGAGGRGRCGRRALGGRPCPGAALAEPQPRERRCANYKPAGGVSAARGPAPLAPRPLEGGWGEEECKAGKGLGATGPPGGG